MTAAEIDGLKNHYKPKQKCQYTGIAGGKDRYFEKERCNGSANHQRKGEDKIE
jgi:hypothetical protein